MRARLVRGVRCRRPNMRVRLDCHVPHAPMAPSLANGAIDLVPTGINQYRMGAPMGAAAVAECLT